MKLIEINWHPTDRQLRQFGFVALVALPLVGGLWGGWPVAMWLAAIGALCAGVGLIRPRWLKPVFLGLSLVTAPIGIVMGELATLVVFFCVFLPIGCCFRLLQRDALQLKKGREQASYWQRKGEPGGLASYFRQW